MCSDRPAMLVVIFSRTGQGPIWVRRAPLSAAPRKREVTAGKRRKSGTRPARSLSLKESLKMPIDRPDHENLPESSWHIDKTVNLTVAFGFFAAITSGIWFAATSSARLDLLEKQMAVYAPLGDRITRLESKMDTINAVMFDIKSMLRVGPQERK